MDRAPGPSAESSTEFKRELLASLPGLRAFAMSLIGQADRADDLVQETLVKAWDKQQSFQPGTNLKAWLFTILRNEFYSQMRKRGREVQDTDGSFSAQLAVHPSQYGSLDLQDFRAALEQLPDDQREAIILIGASGFAYEEAAEICGCAVGTIKSRVSRARARLQEILQIEGEGDFGPDSDSARVTMRSFAWGSRQARQGNLPGLSCSAEVIGPMIGLSWTSVSAPAFPLNILAFCPIPLLSFFI